VRSLDFHPEAQAELIGAGQYFEGEAENLGLDFIDFVQRPAVRLLRFPTSGRRVGRRLRRVVVPRFFYLLLYRVERERIFIVAVAHPRRRPGYWRSRL
jgi:plasmid stabilization system protein ParE